MAGKDGVAGELGHFKVWGNEEPCGCGNTGCMENLAGGKYLARLCRELYRELYRDTTVDKIFKKYGKETLLQEYVDRMAITVSTEINILNPDYILIGGGVPNMDGFPLEYLDKKIREHTRKPYPEAALNIIYTDDEKMKTVLGAAAYVRKI